MDDDVASHAPYAEVTHLHALPVFLAPEQGIAAASVLGGGGQRLGVGVTSPKVSTPDRQFRPLSVNLLDHEPKP